MYGENKDIFLANKKKKFYEMNFLQINNFKINSNSEKVKMLKIKQHY